MGAFKAMAPCKGTLISLPLNCSFQQMNYFVITKYERVIAHLGFIGKADGTTGPGCFSLSHVDTLSLRQTRYALKLERQA
jgi:hypothetical protein